MKRNIKGTRKGFRFVIDAFNIGKEKNILINVLVKNIFQVHIYIFLYFYSITFCFTRTIKYFKKKKQINLYKNIYHFYILLYKLVFISIIYILYILNIRQFKRFINNDYVKFYF